MPESFMDRAALGRGKQRAFVEKLLKKSSIVEMARLCNCSERTVRDWRREKYLMPITALALLAKAGGVPVPKHRVLDVRARLRVTGSAGGLALIAKYGRIPGDEAYRQRQWRVWWDAHGKFIEHPLFTAKAIKKPRHSVRLAEFIGIMMGDGGLSRYQAIVSLNSRDDAKYIVFVSALIKTLFGVTPSLYHDPKDHVTNVVVSRSNLVQFLHGLGLPIGDKLRQGLDMPAWIKARRQYTIACIRGLVDTDGCIFTHRYQVNGKWYAYKKLSFTSASPPLITSVYSFLKENGFNPRVSRGGRDVRLDSIADMRRYFTLIGSHNPKHLKRYGKSSTIGKTGGVRRMVSQRFAKP